MITPSFSPTATERVLPKLAFDFTTASLDPRITFTRTTDSTHPATYVDNTGYIVSASDNQARFNYNSVSLVCDGLLKEESRTNIVLSSSDFRSAANGNPITFWANTRATVPSAAVTSPANDASVYKLQEDSTASNSHLVGCTFSATSGTTYTCSVFVKAADTRCIRLQFSGAFAALTTATVNPVDGSSAGGGGAGSSFTVTSYKNSWYRLTLTAPATSTATGSFNIFLVQSLTGSASYSGDGTSGAYIWGSQLEIGEFVTSYIPTTSASLTRNLDVATTDQGVVNQGAFVVNSIVISGKTLITSGSVTFTATASTEQKIAVSYDVTSVNQSISAAAVTTSPGATASTTIEIGPSATGFFKKVFFYLPKLIDAELQAFSK